MLLTNKGTKMHKSNIPETDKDEQRIREVVDNVKFMNWNLFVGNDGDRLYLQVKFDAECVVTGDIQRQHCRKYFLSKHMCETEIVRTAHQAVHTAMEHEVNEHFLYKGVRVYNPHVSIDALMSIADKEQLRT
jgi:hypothetical protein